MSGLSDDLVLRRALVLGGAGFLGSWIVRELRSRGVDSTVLGYGAARPGDIALPITQLTVAEALTADEYDAVFFTAGSPSVPRSLSDPLQDLHDNVGLVLEILEALRHLSSPPLFVFTSSAAVYGDALSDPMEEDHPLVPRSQYGVSKLAAEQYVRLYAESHGIRGFSVRPFSVYGPGQRKLVVYDLARRLLEGEDPLLVAAPREVARDFVYVGDAARATIELSVHAPASGEAYNIASGVATTLADLTEQLVAAAELAAEVRFTGSLRAGDPLRWRGGTARTLGLGVACSTPLSLGLRETLRWIRDDLRSPAAH